MERTKYLIAGIIFIIYSTFLVQSQNKEKIYAAYISGNMTQWKNIIIQVEQLKKNTIASEWELIDLYYGYIAWCIGNKRKDEAEIYIDRANDLIEKLEKTGNNPSSLKAYKAAIIGFKIGLSPYKAPFIGPKGMTFAEDAVKLNSNNPLALIEQGNVLYFAPSIVGGSKPEAIKNYVKAIAIMDKDPVFNKNNWRYLNVLTFIYQAYIDEKQPVNAANIKKKIETIEPNFQWIKNVDKNKYL